MIPEAAEAWVREHVAAVTRLEPLHEEPWATVVRVPLANGVAWFKACAREYAFEARLTAALGARWPDRVAEVIAYDAERAWLLLGHAGTALGASTARPESWLAVLPSYSELQRGELPHARDHLDHGVPDLRTETLAERYEEFVRRDLPHVDRLRKTAPRVAQLCRELAATGIGDTVQHDDLHGNNVYDDGVHLRVLDWGDASISHPFFSLVETYRFLELGQALAPGHPWYARLRDAYLEPWGHGLEEVFELALRVGAFAHLIACIRPHELMAGERRTAFEAWFGELVERALPLARET